LQKRGVTAKKKACTQGLVARGVSVVRACLATGLSRSGYYRPEKDWRTADAAVINAINDVLKKSPQAGFWKCFRRLRFNKHPFNHKRVYRVYCRLGLNLKRRTKHVLPKRTPQPLAVENKPNHQWALDFMHDTLYCGKRYRTLNVLDEGTRECLAIEVDSSLSTDRVIRTLEQLKAERGLPQQIRLETKFGEAITVLSLFQSN